MTASKEITNPSVMVKTVFFKAPPEFVWPYLVEAEKLGRWFHAPKTDYEVGADYQMLSTEGERKGQPLLWGRVLEMSPPVRLVHTFTHPHLQERETLCTWTLDAVEGGTRLTLIHEGLMEADDALGSLASHDAGWDEHFVKLRELVAETVDA
ncbi:MAG: SRPBCC domain-containing protein [Pseudomonadota bacterium]